MKCIRHKQAPHFQRRDFSLVRQFSGGLINNNITVFCRRIGQYLK